MSMTTTPERIAAGVQALWSASGGDLSATADEMHAVFYAMQEAAPTPQPVALVPLTCAWVQDDEGSEVWSPSCGKGMFSLTEGGPKDNGMKFCCYCGKPVDELPWVEPADDEGQA